MEEINRRADQLDKDVRAIVVATEANTAAMDRLERRLDRADKDRHKFVLALTALAMLIVFLGVETVRLEQSINDQNALRNRVLCPLYGIFLGSYDPQSRPEGDARRKYEDAFVVIREGNAEMHCTAPLVPPRTSPTPDQ